LAPHDIQNYQKTLPPIVWVVSHSPIAAVRRIRWTWRLSNAAGRISKGFQANTMACMDFISELTRVKGPTEAFELWSRQAQSYLQRMSEQSQELATLGRKTASSSAEPLMRGFDQMFKRAS
jgi:hypothetical protein